MSLKWIVIVSRANARVFSEQRMNLIAELKNELGRTKNREMTTGKPGVGRNRMASRTSTHNLTGGKDPHEDAAVVFARRIGMFLTKQMNLGNFTGLLIVAEPRMMGHVKAAMGRKLAGRTEWLRKDFGKLKAHELKRALGGKGWSGTASPFNS